VGGPEVPHTTAVVRGSTATGLFLSNGNLRVDISNLTGLVVATRLSDGFVLLNQSQLYFGKPLAPKARSGAYSVNVTFAGHGAAVNERIYGLGEHRTGKVNQMPYEKEVAKSQIYGDSGGADVSIPWFCSSLGYGFVWNTPAYGHVTLNTDVLQWSSWAQLNADFCRMTGGLEHCLFCFPVWCLAAAQLQSSSGDNEFHASDCPSLWARAHLRDHNDVG
jgi:alpha-glucosidase (family GH31 glycosyl hydrolase)